MNTFVALLRGINVSGQKLNKMKDLTTMFQDMGFKNVQTYIQSGNIVFDSELSDLTYLDTIISEQIKRTFGFDVPVLVRSPGYLEQILKKSPFEKYEDFDLKKCAYVFLKNTPEPDRIEDLQNRSYENERFMIENQCLYLYCMKGAGRAKLHTNEIERRLGVEATARNNNTLVRLVSMTRSRSEK
jgi:uncharacterized protein (DUF1697 family)